MEGDGTRNDFDRLVAAAIPAALRFAVRLTGNVEAAEEVVQEALYRAARSRDSFRGDASLRTWLLRIVIHAFRDGQATSQRRPTAPLLADPVDPRQPLPERAALEAELGERIAAHVASLPPRQREVLVLTVYEQLGAAEIAELLGITVDSVHVNLYHARTRLKTLLAVYLAEK